MHSSTTALACLIALAAACAPPEGHGVRPAIDVDVCSRGDSTSECAVDFGVLRVHASRSFPITVHNPSALPLTVTAVTVDDDDDGVFTASFDNAAAVIIEPGLSLAIDVAFRPVALGDVSGTLTIDSDAENVDGPIVVALRGEGAAAAVAVASDCEFGDVVVGNESAVCEVRVRAPDGEPLLVTDVALPPPFFALGSLALPLTINDELVLELVARPSAVGVPAGALSLSFLGGDVVVPLTVNALPPLAGLYVEATSTTGLVVLHVARDDTQSGAEWCSPLDCYVDHCDVAWGRDGQAPVVGRSPNVSSFVLEAPQSASYFVGVTGDAGASLTVKTFSGGSLESESSIVAAEDPVLLVQVDVDDDGMTFTTLERGASDAGECW